VKGRMGSLPRPLIPGFHQDSCVLNTAFSGISGVDGENSCDLVRIQDPDEDARRAASLLDPCGTIPSRRTADAQGGTLTNSRDSACSHSQPTAQRDARWMSPRRPWALDGRRGRHEERYKLSE
jgi:hypothetical protein